MYLNKKTDEIKTVEKLIKKSSYLQGILNSRQISLINRALKKPNSVFYIESHRGSHNVTYDTTRTDLLKLVDIGLLEKKKIGKAFRFTSIINLHERLEHLGNNSDI